MLQSLHQIAFGFSGVFVFFFFFCFFFLVIEKSLKDFAD